MPTNVNNSPHRTTNFYCSELLHMIGKQYDDVDELKRDLSDILTFNGLNSSSASTVCTSVSIVNGWSWCWLYSWLKMHLLNDSINKLIISRDRLSYRISDQIEVTYFVQKYRTKVRRSLPHCPNLQVNLTSFRNSATFHPSLRTKGHDVTSSPLICCHTASDSLEACRQFASRTFQILEPAEDARAR